MAVEQKRSVRFFSIQMQPWMGGGVPSQLRPAQRECNYACAVFNNFLNFIIFKIIFFNFI